MPRAVAFDSKDSKYSTIPIDHFGYDKSNWRDVMFVPFNLIWEIMIQFTILINNFIILLQLLQIGEENDNLNYVYYFMEICYATDTILTLMHRFMYNHRRRRLFRPRNAVMLIIDILTLIPYWELYRMIYWKGQHYHRNDTYNRMKCFIRCVRLFIFYNAKRNQVSFNQLALISAWHFVILTMITIILTVLWFKITQKDGRTWISKLKYHKINERNRGEMLTLGYFIMTSLLAHHWIGRIRGERIGTRMIVIAGMFLGFLLHMLILNGQLTAIYLKVFRKQNDYTKQLNLAKNLFSEWQLDYGKSSKIQTYYEELWDKQDGIRFMPQSFKLLPLSLQKEVCLDIFWEALRHSHIFNRMDMSFKREIALLMRNDCLLTGDYLFKTNELKSKMIYIVCGIIEILSKEDNNSPILSFSNGTILGEIASVVPMTSCCNVRCATYCEFYVLQSTDLYRALILYRNRTKSIQSSFYGRVQNARKIYSDRHSNKVAQETTIRKLKRQWRDMVYFKLKSKNGVTESFSNGAAETIFCSSYLDLLVFTDSRDLKLKAICVYGVWPCIMYPDSSIKVFVDYCSIGAILYQCFLVPYLAANLNSKYSHKDHLGEFVILDIIYMIDVYMQFITAVRVQNNIVQNPVTTVMYRAKEVTFLIDFLAILPLDYIGYACNFNQNVIGILRTPKVLRFYKLVQYALIKERILTTHILFIRCLKFIIIYVLVAYGFSCLFLRLTCYDNNCRPYGWLAYGKKLLDHDVNVSIAREKFYVGLHYSISIITALGNNNFAPYSYLDMATYCLATYTGYYIFSFMLSQLTATYVHSSNVQLQYNETIRLLHLYFQTSRVPNYIRTRAYELYNFLYHYNGNAISWGSHSVFDKSPEVKEIVSDMLKGHIKSIPIFKNLHENIIFKIAAASHLYVFPPNSQICAANYKPIWVYLIIRGHCKMYSTVPGDTDRNAERDLVCGDIFPLLECLHMINTFITVTTVTATEAIMIPYIKLLRLLQFDMDHFKCIENALSIHRNDFATILTRSMGFLESQVIASMPKTRPEQGDFFSYKISDDIEVASENGIIKSEKTFSQPFQNLGKFGFIMQCLLMKKTINPRGKMFISLEIFRWHMAFAETVLCLLQGNVLLDFMTEIEIFEHCCLCSCILDFYIRMHCQYYTKQGILVSHPLKTCIHYLTTSFIIDFIAAFPLKYTGIAKPFLGNLAFQYSSTLVFLHVLQLHRMISGLSYFTMESTHATAVAIRSFTTMLVILIILMLGANVLIILTCELIPNNRKFNCFSNNSEENKKWLNDFGFVNSKNNSGITLALASIYAIVSTFTGAIAGIGTAKSVVEAIIIMPGMVVLFFMRVILLVTTGAMQVGGNATITKNQFKLKHFLKYAKVEPVDEELVNEFVKFSEYNWKKGGGGDFVSSFRQLNQVIIMEVRAYMYMDSLKNSYFFNNMVPTYLNSVCYYIRRTSFKKESIIIRCNDINEMLYFVNQGCVDVSIAGTKVVSLTKGGCIGCMTTKGITRHTIKVVAKVHTELLHIRTAKLIEIAKGNSLLQSRIRESHLLNYEYLKSYDKKSSFMWSKADVIRKYDTNMSNIALYFSSVNKVINQESSWYAAYNYILNVHIAPASGLLILFFSFFLYENSFIYPVLCVIWMVDVLFWLRLVLNLHLFYTDSESGLIITRPVKILKRYVKSYRFAFDIIINVPYEILLYYSGVSMNYLKYSILMRVLRIVYLVEYHYTCKSALNVSILLRATALMYTILIQLSGVSLLWWYTSCSHGICTYIDTPGFTSRHMKYLISNNTLQSILLSYTYTVNLFTATGLRDVVPTSINDILISLIISLWGVLSISLFCAAFISMLVINSVIFCDYGYRIEQLRTYLRYRGTSPILMEKVWWYLLELWSLHQGAHSPALIQDMPKYLQQDLMQAIYGKYLENHDLFSNTHIDFLRQLVTKMEGCMYLPGYTIVESGDVTGCMYFIHKGEVEEFDIILSEETITRVYCKGMSFGEVQGLFNVPYRKTYRALSLVNLLSLKKCHWINMLKWFPAANEKILQQVHAGTYDIDQYIGVDFKNIL